MQIKIFWCFRQPFLVSNKQRSHGTRGVGEGRRSKSTAWPKRLLKGMACRSRLTKASPAEIAPFGCASWVITPQISKPLCVLPFSLKKPKQNKINQTKKQKQAAGGGVKEIGEETGMKLCPTSLFVTTSRVTARQVQSPRPTLPARKPPGSPAAGGGGVVRDRPPLPPAGGAARAVRRRAPLGATQERVNSARTAGSARVAC